MSHGATKLGRWDKRLSEAPPSVPCSECGRATDPDSQLTLHEVTGWAQRRKQGGLHALKFKRETGKIMCARCALRRGETGSAQQGQML